MQHAPCDRGLERPKKVEASKTHRRNRLDEAQLRLCPLLQEIKELHLTPLSPTACWYSLACSPNTYKDGRTGYAASFYRWPVAGDRFINFRVSGKKRNEAEDGLRYGKTHYAKVKMLKVLWLLLMMMLCVINCTVNV